MHNFKNGKRPPAHPDPRKKINDIKRAEKTAEAAESVSMKKKTELYDAAEETTVVNENRIEGRNAVIEAYRSGKTIDKIYILDGC